MENLPRDRLITDGPIIQTTCSGSDKKSANRCTLIRPDLSRDTRQGKPQLPVSVRNVRTKQRRPRRRPTPPCIRGSAIFTRPYPFGSGSDVAARCQIDSVARRAREMGRDRRPSRPRDCPSGGGLPKRCWAAGIFVPSRSNTRGCSHRLQKPVAAPGALAACKWRGETASTLATRGPPRSIVRTSANARQHIVACRR